VHIICAPLSEAFFISSTVFSRLSSGFSKEKVWSSPTDTFSFLALHRFKNIIKK